MLLYLSHNIINDHARRKRITTLIDNFVHYGPNKTHVCLVFEPMGPSAARMVDLLPEKQPAGPFLNRYPKQMVRPMLRQALLALDYLHQNGIVHDDFQPGNLLFSVTGLGESDEACLVQGTGPGDASERVRRRDGKRDLWAPEYLAVDNSLSQFVDTGPGLAVILSDLGGGQFTTTPLFFYLPDRLTLTYDIDEAFFASSPPERDVTPRNLRPPEPIFGDKATASLDIWSFGCLVFEFLTGFCLFHVWGMDSEADDAHLLQLSDKLGPLPSSLLSRWRNANTYYNSEGKMVKNYIGDVPGDLFDPEINMLKQPTLEEYFNQRKPADI